MMLNEAKKLTRQHYKIFTLSWAGWVFDFYDLMLFTFLASTINSSLGLNAEMLSICLGISLFATGLGGVIFGALGDKYGRKKVLQWTIILYTLGTVLSAFSWSFYSLVIFRLITGVGIGGEWATGQTYINETFPSQLRAKYSGFMQTGAPIGIILASLVGGFLNPIIGWRYCFLISIIPAVLVIFIRTSIDESDLWIKNKSSLQNKSIINEFKILLNKEYRKMFFLSLILCIFGMFAYWFTYSWLPTFLESEGLSLANSTYSTILISIGNIVGYASFGYVSERLGRRPAFTIYGILMAIGIAMITLCWNIIITVPDLVLVFMFITGFGTGFFGGYGALFSEIFPTKIRNTAIGAVFNISRGVQFVTPIIIVLVSNSIGLSYGVAIAAIFALLSATWIWTFPETKGKNIEELDSS